jgi:hypothetical protein
MVVDVLVLPIDPRHDERDAERVAEAVVERREDIAVDRPHLVVMPGHFADADAARACTRLVLVDELEPEIGANARLVPQPLDTPVRVHHAKRRPAGRGGDRRNA